MSPIEYVALVVGALVLCAAAAGILYAWARPRTSLRIRLTSGTPAAPERYDIRGPGYTAAVRRCWSDEHGGDSFVVDVRYGREMGPRFFCPPHLPVALRLLHATVERTRPVEQGTP